VTATASCPDCGYSFEVGEEHIGKPVQFTCPECQASQTVTAIERKVGRVVWDEDEGSEEKPSVIWDEEEPAKPSVVFEDESASLNPAAAPAEPAEELEPERATEAEGPHCDLIDISEDENAPVEAAVEHEVRSSDLVAPDEDGDIEELQEEPVDVSFPELEGSGRYELEGVASAPAGDSADRQAPPAPAQQKTAEPLAAPPDEEEELLEPEVLEEPREPRARLEAELEAIEYRQNEIRREMANADAWNVEDAEDVLQMKVDGWRAVLRRVSTLVLKRRRGYLIPCRSGYDGAPTAVSPSRAQEYRDLDVRRHVLEGLARSSGLLPQVVLFTGPGLLAWLSLLFFVLMAEAITTVAPVIGAVALVPGALASVALYRGLFLPLRQALKQYRLWKPMGFSAPGRRIYRVLCMLAIAACSLLVGLVVASNLINRGSPEEPASEQPAPPQQ
jgi:hypothetical protein